MKNGANIRSAVCQNLSELGIELDALRNKQPRTAVEDAVSIHAADSSVEIWIVPTNEELVVARQTQQLLQG